VAASPEDRGVTGLGWFITTALMVDAVIIGTLCPPHARLIWNASPSVPIGLYALHDAAPLRVGELVVVDPPQALSNFMAARQYLPRGVPLLKHVTALSGQRVCRTGDAITVEGAAVGVALDEDRAGRALPRWSGCRMIAQDQVFLMNRRPADSFDGRYFGPLATATVVGRADPIWLEGGG
jgi:conjugative transfer signal peptidase TraF